MRSIDEIRALLQKGDAVIVTASELKDRIAADDDITDVDVVTCGTCGVMSGTYAVLSVPVAPPGSFLKAETVTLQGIPAIPGPCPNERLGLVDLMVFGTAHASEQYGGGHLIRDLIAGQEISVCVKSDGKKFRSEITIDDLPFARLFTTRSAFKNYSAIINQADTPVHTIFSVLPLMGSGQEATVSGCGEINPLENDPLLRFLHPGDPIVVNGASGRVIGTGTRSSPEKPNISVHADMKNMESEFCGGFITSTGPECVTSIASAIPVIDDEVLRCLRVRDADIPIPILDISNRQPVGTATYDQVWTNTATTIHYHPNRCDNCSSPCIALDSCPVHAIRDDGTINQHICFVCGTCVRVCPKSVYDGDFGSLNMTHKRFPIVLRQSDRRKGEILCRKVREMLQTGEFTI